MNYWLFKTEPTSYSIDDLAKDKKTGWSGIRNYQSRNYMKSMEVGDEILFYHSSCEIPAVMGLAKVVGKATPDPTQFDRKDSHFDPKATKEKPNWFQVEIFYVKKLLKPVTLSQIKFSTDLKNMVVASRGSRLSIQPVSMQHYDKIVKRGMGK